MTRFSTRVGDIFQTKNTIGGKRYFQLVALDLVDLNSDVIVAYKPEATLHDKNRIVGEVDFYTHTTVTQGLRDGLWDKVSKGAVDPVKLPFKNYNSLDLAEAEKAAGVVPPPVPYPNWSVWDSSDDIWHYVSEEAGKAIVAESGGIVPASDVIYRIKNGRSQFKSNWPN